MSKTPEYSYPKFDSTDLDQILLKIDGQLGDTKYDLWLKNKLEDISLSAIMLKASGTKTFSIYRQKFMDFQVRYS